MSQTYSNHRHFPTAGVFSYGFAIAAAVSFGLAHLDWHTQMWTMAFLIGAALSQAVIGRRYVTRLQDRIIKLEMRYRTDKMLSPDLAVKLWNLSRSQVVALRFAPDGELPGLIERAAREQMSANDIKKAIKDWQGDFDRT